MPSDSNPSTSKRPRPRSPSYYRKENRSRSRSLSPELSSPSKRPRRIRWDESYRYRQYENKVNTEESSKPTSKLDERQIEESKSSRSQNPFSNRKSVGGDSIRHKRDLSLENLPNSNTKPLDVSRGSVSGVRPQEPESSQQDTLMQRVRQSLARKYPNVDEFTQGFTATRDLGELYGVNMEGNATFGVDDMANDGNAGPTNNISREEQETLLRKLEEQKSRLSTFTQNAAEADDEATNKDLDTESNISPDSAPSIGLSIRGAARKAREERAKVLKEMEARLRMQALLHIKLAREKTKLTGNNASVGNVGKSNLMEDNKLSSPVREAEPHPPETPVVLSPQKQMHSSPLSSPDKSHADKDLIQRMLKEKLLKEKLMLAQRTAKGATSS
jgi:hypothetical protein